MIEGGIEGWWLRTLVNGVKPLRIAQFACHRTPETSGKTAATCRVSLIEGVTLLAKIQNVNVHSGSTERVTFRGIQLITAGQHSITVRISDSDPAEADVSNNAYSFSLTALLRPDLRVESATAPAPLFVNTAFDIDAVVREYNGQSGATATISLYEGKDLQVQPRNITVAAGGSTHILFQGIKEKTTGTHTYTIKISDVDPDEVSDANNNYTFSVVIVVRPDLTVNKVTAPQTVSAGIPFSVDALVKETDGQSGSTATVSLFEGNTSLASTPNVVVPAGGISSVTFSGIVAATKGNHTYTVKITNSVPAESDVSNNNLNFTLSAVARPDLRVDNITAPSSTPSGIPFTVTAAIKEYNGLVGATATVTLYEGPSVIGAAQTATLSAGGSVNVVFQGIVSAVPGSHTYTVTISNSNPAESDVSNNSRSFGLTVIGRPDLSIDGPGVTPPLYVNTPFTVSATVHELSLQAGASATVTLYEGASVIGTPQSVTVSAGGTATVSFQGITEASSGSHTLTIRISNAAPGESNVTNNDCTLPISILVKPDLAVDHVSAPPQVTANTPFDVQVTVHELSGQSGASATVSLYEGATLLATQVGIVVPAGGIVTVTFHGITAPTSGSHTYTAVVSGATPGESNLTNNQNTGSTSVIDLNPLQYSLVYAYDRQIHFTRQTSNYGWNSLDSTYVESGSVTYAASASTTTLPSSPITSLSWTIASPSGAFDQTSISNLSRSSGDVNTDYYVMTNVNGKGIDFTMMVDRANNVLQISIQQQGASSNHIFVTPEATQITQTGDHSAVVQPNGSLSVTLAMQSGESTWGGTTTISVSPLISVTSSYTDETTWVSIEDGTKLRTETAFYHTRSAGPGAPSTSASARNNQVAVNEDQGSTSVPLKFGLQQNYPNPFNPSTTIEFALPKASYVTVKVYDLLARELATIVTQDYLAGTHTLRWDARSLPSGVYVYRITAGEYVAQKKLILLK